ncbi:hypothetical protein [Pseudomonas brenneri]|uniref:hypothetical protein n=1 Tax=Pseudomonas brenneri TaxID=129817 RepID=UPI003B9EE5F0
MNLTSCTLSSGLSGGNKKQVELTAHGRFQPFETDRSRTFAVVSERLQWVDSVEKVGFSADLNSGTTIA